MIFVDKSIISKYQKYNLSKEKLFPNVSTGALILFAQTSTINYHMHSERQMIEGSKMKYMSVSETAERWSVSTRRIQILCNEGRMPGAIRIGRTWAIPDDESKPTDARIKSGKYIKSKLE